MEENVISDEKLTKYFSKENLEEMALLFSNGNFSELINKFFYISPRSESVGSSQISERSTLPPSGAEQTNQNQNISNNNNTNNNNNNNQFHTPNIMPGRIQKNPRTPPPLTTISQTTQEFNYNLFEKLNEDELCQQILLTIALFCLLKKKNFTDSEEAKMLINKYNYPHYDMIFPLILLKAKYIIKTKNIPKAIDILNDAIYLYEEYKLHLDEKKKGFKKYLYN